MLYRVYSNNGKDVADYSLVDFCLAIVERWSLRERELTKIVRMKVGSSFRNHDLIVERVL